VEDTLANNNAPQRPLFVSALALFVLLLGACGGAASPSVPPAGGASSQAAASQAAPPAATSVAVVASNAPAPANTEPACLVITAAEAANVLGKAIRETRPGLFAGACQFIVDPIPPLPAHTLGTAYAYNFIQVNLGASSGRVASADRSSSSGLSQASVFGIKGDKSVTLLLSDTRRDGQHPDAVAVPITDATFTALKALLVTALTRI
jgi:hypothetical protein